MIYLILAVTSSMLVSVIMRVSEKHIHNNITMLASNYLMCSVLAAICTGTWNLFPVSAEGFSFSVGLGLISGLFYMGSFMLLQWNVKTNGIVLSSMFMKLGVMVPTLMAILVFGEVPKAVQVIGMIVALAAILLINLEKGSGMTHIGGVTGGSARLQPIADAFTACGLEADCVENVQKLIWQKMFTNVSASVLTGVLQVPLGYIAQNPNAWAVCEALIREAVAVAAGEGLDFDAEQKIAEVREVCEKSPNGLTSIYADLHNGRRSEVDTISGSVVRASERNGVPAPTHRAMVNLVHAMEGKPKA